MLGVYDRVLGTLGDPHRPPPGIVSGGRVALLSAEQWSDGPDGDAARRA